MADWFDQHYVEAADQILEFFAADGLTLAEKVVADIGCGDGIIDLALMHRGEPRQLTGFDLNPVNVDHLNGLADERGLPGVPDGLHFARSAPTVIPAPDDTFDVVVTWSAFEHVGDPLTLMRDIGRVLKPEGVLFLQIWPMYHSQHGGHLWDWVEGDFPHLMRSGDEVQREILASGHEHASYMAGEVRYLNRATIDDLQRAILAAGLAVRKLELMTSTVHIPQALMRYPLSDLGITGIKLLATPMT